MTGKRICIVTPAQLSANPRVVKEATALQDAGYDVTVVATRINSWTDAQDQTILDTATWTTALVDMRFRPRYLLDRLLQAAATGLFKLINGASLGPLVTSPYARAIAMTAMRTKADLYIGHYPPGLAAAAGAARRNNAPYAYDVEDYHPGEFDAQQQGSVLQQAIIATEDRYIRGATYVTAAAPGIGAAYAARYGVSEPVTVLNTFAKAEAPAESSNHGTAQPRPSLYWFSQTIGPFRGLENAVRAVGRSKTKPHLYLRGTPMPDFLDHLNTLAREGGVDSHLHVLPPAAPSEMVKLASIYDAGLVAEIGHTESRRIALTNKQFTYLLAGLPCLMSAIPAHRTLAADIGPAGCLFDVDDPASLAMSIDALFESDAGLAQRRQHAYTLGQDRYNFENDAQALVDRVGMALRSASPVNV